MPDRYDHMHNAMTGQQSQRNFEGPGLQQNRDYGRHQERTGLHNGGVQRQQEWNGQQNQGRREQSHENHHRLRDDSIGRIAHPTYEEQRQYDALNRQ